MRNLAIALLIVALLYYATRREEPRDFIPALVQSIERRDPSPAPAVAAPSVETPPQASFQCDGRTHCSQMHSCAEAEYFLAHCPNTKMDGDNDGVPCERQWCE